MIVFNKWSFSFKNWDGNCLLLILISSEDLRLFGWNVRSLWNDFSHDSTNCFNTQTQRSSIDNDQTFSFIGFFTTDDTSLDGSTIANSFIWIDTSVSFLSIEEILNNLSNLWNSAWSSNQNDFVDFSLFEFRVFQSSLHGTSGLLEEIIVQFFKLSSGEYFIEVQTID